MEWKKSICAWAIEGTDYAFTHADLEAAWDKVHVPTVHWKEPIDRVLVDVTDDEKIAIDAAVRYFAGCGVTFTKVSENLTRATAVGYYAAVGA